MHPIKSKDDLQREVADFERKMEDKKEEKVKEMFEEEALRLGNSPLETGYNILAWVDERSALQEVPSWTRRFGNYLITEYGDEILEVLRVRLNP